jgi:hypothetical protein
MYLLESIIIILPYISKENIRTYFVCGRAKNVREKKDYQENKRFGKLAQAISQKMRRFIGAKGHWVIHYDLRRRCTRFFSTRASV